MLACPLHYVLDDLRRAGYPTKTSNMACKIIQLVGWIMLMYISLSCCRLTSYTNHFMCDRVAPDAYLEKHKPKCSFAPRGHLKSFGHHQAKVKEITTLDYFPDPETFYRDYIRKSVPLLIKGALNGWVALEHWKNLTYFREHFGKERMQVLFKKEYDPYHYVKAIIPMSEYLDLYETKSVYMDTTCSPRMMKDMIWPKFLHCNDLLKMVKQVAMFFNAGGSSSDIHLDVTETFMGQVTGSRVWLLMKPDHAPDLYTDNFPPHAGISPIDQEQVDFYEFSKAANIEIYNVTVDTGDMIYVPEGWFHQVRAYGNPNHGLAIFLNYLNCHSRFNMPLRDTTYVATCQAWLQKQPKEIKCPNDWNETLPMDVMVKRYYNLNPDAFDEPANATTRRIDEPEKFPMRSGQKLVALGYRVENRGDDPLSNIWSALNSNFRLFETSMDDGTELLLGQGLKSFTSVKREDVQIIVKIHPNYLGYKTTKQAVERSLRHLDTKYIDVLILQAPDCNQTWAPCRGESVSGSWKDSWKAMEELVAEGKVLALGVAHFSLEQLRELVASAAVPLSVVQDRFDPLEQQVTLRAFCEKNNIVFVGHSILGHQIVKDGLAKKNPVLESQYMKVKGFRFRTCAAAFTLRWAMKNHVVSLFHSTSHWHIIYNYNSVGIWDFIDSSAWDDLSKVFVENQHRLDEFVEDRRVN